MTKRNDSGIFGRMKRAGRWLAGATRERVAALAKWLFVSVIALLVYWWAEIIAWAATPVPGGAESYGEVLRNLALLAAAVIGLPLAIWRSWVAERQTRVAQKQATTSERGLLHDRYQKSAEMLGSDAPTVRMGGIYALERLAAEQTEEYHIQVMNLLCAFLRAATANLPDDVDGCLADTLAAAMVIGYRNPEQIKLARKKNDGILNSQKTTQWPDLRGINLTKALLTEADFSGADFSLANLSGAKLPHANLSGANLVNANLSRVVLMKADLTDADILGANISGAYLVGAKGVTQSKLNNTFAEIDQPPEVGGARCAESGKLLVWDERHARNTLLRARVREAKKSNSGR